MKIKMLNIHSILFRTDERCIDDIVKRSYLIPEGFVQKWSIEKKSRFIESVLARIPVIPKLICEELPCGKWKIVFGVEEFLCLKQFYNNEFALVNCEYEVPSFSRPSSIECKKYNQLPPILQNRFDGIYVTIIAYDAHRNNSNNIDHIYYENVMKRIAEFK